VAQAEFQINPDEISSALRRNITDFRPRLAREEVGRVEEVGDGIARVAGLPTAMANEMLEFPRGVTGLAMNLEEDSIGAVILGEADRIEEGDPVKQTGRVLSVGVGDEFLGRVVNALGRPLDGKGPIKASNSRQLEVQAPGVTARQPVKNPLQTGIKAIDAMTAIGRGQRQLIIGDRQTGKTAIVIDAIINQRENWGTDDAVKCIYVAIGQKASTIAEVVGSLEETGTRGLPWRRLLSALAAVGARRKALGRERRRIAYRAADYRDQGRRRLRLHSHQRHLDHRRADLLGNRPLLLRRPPRHQRGHIGVTGWR
jgi:F-type H+-transporting ATPase subunit alpha